MKKTDVSFESLYEDQILYQKRLLISLDKCQEDAVKDVPCDDTKWFSYHMQAMIEELGEVSKADKRWKTHRNENYNKAEKYFEIADVFITAMNLAIYSGMSYEELKNVVREKIKENFYKL